MSTDADSVDVDAVMALWGVPVEKACADLHRLGLVDGDGVAKAGLTPEDWEQVKQIRRVFAGRVGQLYTRHMRDAGLVPRDGGKATRRRVGGIAFRGAQTTTSLNPREWLLQTPMCQDKAAQEALRDKLFAPPKSPPRWSTTLSLGGGDPRGTNIKAWC